MMQNNLIGFARGAVGNAVPDDPHHTHLRRATSAAYYAMFHCLAESCADLIAGEYPRDVSRRAWVQVYRALEHGVVKNRAGNQRIFSRFSPDIKDFASIFVRLQDKRNDADYNPFATFSDGDVEVDIDDAETAINNFERISDRERRNFAIYILISIRNIA